MRGSIRSRARALRRSQCSSRSPNIWQAQPTPPSRKANRRAGKRRVTPPKKMALETAWPAAAKWPMWLYTKFDGDKRRPWLLPAL